MQNFPQISKVTRIFSELFPEFFESGLERGARVRIAQKNFPEFLRGSRCTLDLITTFLAAGG